jgi:hypothetical protein
MIRLLIEVKMENFAFEGGIESVDRKLERRGF